MNFAFRFKQTKAVKFPATDQKLLQDIATYRTKILEFDQQDCLNGNLDKSLALEQLLMNYIALLDEIVLTQTNIEIQFFWNDSYEPNKFVQSNQWYYEYACQLYNLGLLYYHLGQKMPSVKEALTKSRNAQWSFQQLQEVLPFVITKTVKQHSDLSFVHVHMHYCYSQAYGYKRLFDNFHINQQPMEVLKYLSEAMKLYDQTIRCLLQTKQLGDKKIPQLLFNCLMERFTNDSALASVIYDIELAKVMAEGAVEDPKDQRMGKALTHLMRAETTIKKQFKTYKQQSQLLVAQLQQITILKKEFEYKNDRIYKQKPVKESELLVIELQSEIVKVKPPEVFQKKYDEKYQQFEEGKKLVLQLIDSINQKKIEAQSKYTKLQANYENIMSQYNIKYMLDAFQNAEELKLTPSIKEKIDLIRKKGGWRGCCEQVQAIKTLQRESGQKIINIKSLLENQITGKPQSQGYFLLQQQIENFQRIREDMQKRLLEANVINHNTEEEIKKQKEQLLFAEQNDAMITSKLSQSLQASQQYYKKNLIVLKRLSVIFDVMQTKFTITKQQLGEIEKYIDDLGLDKKQNQEMDQFLFQQVIKAIDDYLKQYDATVNSINLQELESLAAQLQDKTFMNLATQDEQSVEQAMQKIIDEFQNLDYAQQFYEQIRDQINQFSQVVEEILKVKN